MRDGGLRRDSNCDFVSNHDMDDLRVAALDAGRVGYVIKETRSRFAALEPHQKWRDYESNWSKKTSPFLAYAWSNEG